MKKTFLTTLFVLSALMLIYFGIYRKFNKKYDLKISWQIPQSSANAVNESVLLYYYQKGEYPLNVVGIDSDVNFEDSTIVDKYVMCYWMQDFFVDPEGVLVYYPLYNRTNKKRESFILLSAGIDGKIDNIYSENDTLYIDSWWKEIKTYNLNRIIQYNYFNFARYRNGYIMDNGGIIEMDPYYIYPEFSVKDLFTGKKDLILQLDSLPYRETMIGQ